MFDANKLERALKGAIQTDEITFDEVVTDFSNYKYFYLIMTIIEAILTADNNTTLDTMIDNLTANLTMEQEEEVLDLLTKVLTYFKVPTDMIESLTDEDEELSKSEFKLLQQLVEETIGDGDIFEFVGYALHNPQLDDAQLDDVQLDWAFYSSGSACNAQKKKTTGFKKQCVKGYKAGVKGFWLYPKDFENKATSGISASNHKSKGANMKYKPSPNRIWKSKSLTAWRKSMRKHGRLNSKKSKAKEVGV